MTGMHSLREHPDSFSCSTLCFYLETKNIVHERCWEGKWGVRGEDTQRHPHPASPSALLLPSHSQLLGPYFPHAPAAEFLDERSRSCGKPRNFERCLGDRRDERWEPLTKTSLTPSPWPPHGVPRGSGVLHQGHSRPHAGCCCPELGRCLTSSPGLGVRWWHGDKSSPAAREGRVQVTASYRNEWGCGSPVRFLVLRPRCIKGECPGSGSVPGHGGAGQRRGPAAPAEAAPHRDRHGGGRRLPAAAWPG